MGKGTSRRGATALLALAPLTACTSNRVVKRDELPSLMERLSDKKPTLTDGAGSHEAKEGMRVLPGGDFVVVLDGSREKVVELDRVTEVENRNHGARPALIGGLLGAAAGTAAGYAADAARDCDCGDRTEGQVYAVVVGGLGGLIVGAVAGALIGATDRYAVERSGGASLIVGPDRIGIATRF